jgi:tight adherence protein C
MIAIVAVACALAVGLWLLLGALWPAPVRLAIALRRLHGGGWSTAMVTTRHDEAGGIARLGAWVSRRVRPAVFADERTMSDLRVLDRSPAVFAGATILAAVAGMLAGPLLWAVASVGVVPLPFVVPLASMVVGALVGWSVPRAALGRDAARARRDFRHALGAYLDVLVLLLAAHEGAESAMDLAARAGRGPAFTELRDAVSQARLSGEAVWERLDELGREMRLPELREIAAAGALAGESGAAVRRSLTAKARALRASALAEAETAARRQSQAMFAPLVLMGMGFVLFLVYPLITNLSIGGP